MERLKKWKNRTGTFGLGDVIYGPGEIFNAYDSQVPQIFRNTIDCLGYAVRGVADAITVKEVVAEAPVKEVVDETPVFTRKNTSKGIQVQVPPVTPTTPIDINVTDEVESLKDKFIVSPREGAAGWFNVLNIEDGTIANFNALRRADADTFAEEMNHGDTK
jgi:hypothetical protein